MVHKASRLNVAHRSERASLPPFQHFFHTLHPVITGFMEVIIAAFEMQIGALYSEIEEFCRASECVLSVCVPLWHTMMAASLSLTPTYCLRSRRWWERLTLRWNGRPSWRLEPSQRKVANSQYSLTKSELCLLLLSCRTSSTFPFEFTIDHWTWTPIST